MNVVHLSGRKVGNINVGGNSDNVNVNPMNSKEKPLLMNKLGVIPSSGRAAAHCDLTRNMRRSNEGGENTREAPQSLCYPSG